MNGLSVLKRRAKQGCKIAVFPVAFIYVTVLLYQHIDDNFLWEGRTWKDKVYLRPQQKQLRRFDIIVNSYMRAGSSFTGRLLGFREDVFYWYEPLWNFNCVVYYRGKEEVCSSDIHRCTNVTHAKSNVTRRYHKLAEMEDFLEKIYRCNFTTMEKGIADGMTDVLSGRVWEPYRNCRKSNSSKSSCLLKMEISCKQAKHRVTKVLRMSADNLQNILIRNPTVKVIQLFRDPRAVINSRITTDWYYLKENPKDVNYKAIRENADGLCKRMVYDLKKGKRLQKQFPTRFAFLLFEDVYSNIQERSSDIYRYIGMTEPKENDKYLNNSDIGKFEHTVVKKSDDFSSWWRTQLSFSAAKAVEDVCSEVFSLFHFQKFPSEDLMRDLNTASWKMQPIFETKQLKN